MRRRWVWGIVLGITAQLVCAVAHAQCSKDTDCKGDRICSNGECTTPGTAQAPAAGQPASAAPQPAPVALQPAPASAPGPVVVAPAPARSLPPTEPVAYRRNNSGLMWAGVAAGGVGVVALITGIGFGVASKNCRSDLGDAYAPYAVPTNASDQLDKCQSQASTSTVLVLVGLGLTVAGVPMFVVGGRKVPVVSSSATLTPWLGRREGGLTLRLSL